MEAREYEVMFRHENDHWWYVGLHDLVAGSLSRLLPDGGSFLDAGCGTGRLLESLSETKTAGFDVSEIAIGFARKRNLKNLLQASILNVPFKTDTFDAMVSLDTLYYAGQPGDRDVLKEFHRVVKPGGYVALNLPAFEFMRGEHDIAVHITKRYARRELVGMLEEAGLKIKLITYRNTFLFPLAFIVRTVQKLFPAKGQARSDVKGGAGLMNSLLKYVLLLENRMISGGARFPFGLSLFCVAYKPLEK